jgi:hypothetical protein
MFLVCLSFLVCLTLQAFLPMLPPLLCYNFCFRCLYVCFRYSAVAGVPPLANTPAVAGVPSLANTPAVAGVLLLLSTPTFAGVPSVANILAAANTPAVANAPDVTSLPIRGLLRHQYPLPRNNVHYVTVFRKRANTNASTPKKRVVSLACFKRSQNCRRIRIRTK